MKNAITVVRPMQESDLSEVLRIQAASYAGDIPESRASLTAKLLAAPTSCFVAHDERQLLGYVFALPWSSGAPPALNSPDCLIPSVIDCLYVHDLAVDPGARGGEVARSLFVSLLPLLDQFKLNRMFLTAVQNSSSFWQKQGFVPVQTSEGIDDKLRTYGADAVYMCRLTSD
ncbi:GNAT family N-acetyltransferase [Undibacterium sp. LX40W]|uniref:GNAT family N-acetyltransferase n=1 Tax=Undibacterium nitidum TaxID=2762298 RepID=A0A923HQQ5_9BURK|nr:MULTISPECIES: GNAT family N-acetyltransferase [Undibacterium]MBC3882823.1 GNAT family N-acetyltransferase [Undibacterium nitidum]MBC3892994.1 GNAT family N-acetyltransferase [Undibacterium sp. LX40W]